MATLNIEGRPPDKPTLSELRLQASLLASAVTVIVSLVARYALGGPLVPEVLSDFVFAVIPISIVEAGVSLLGPFAKQLGFLACVVLYFLALTGSAIIFLRLNRSGLAHGVFLVLFAWAATMLVLFPLLGAGVLGADLRQGRMVASLWMLAIYAVFALAVSFFSTRYLVSPTGRGVEDTTNAVALRPGRFLPTTLIGRRGIARWTFYAILGVAAYDIGRALLDPWLRLGAGRVRHGSGVFPNIDGLATEVTSVSDFYEVSKNVSDPDVDVRKWQLQIGGLVRNTFSLSYDEIRQLPFVEQYCTLECISNQVGGDLIGNALWRGVKLRDLLEQGALKPGVVDIVLKAADGYTDSIPLERALADGTILAYEMNGVPLNQTHGFPLRLIVPGIYGMKNVKWITGIEAVDYDFKGYWQKRGWDDRAEYKTMSRIDAPDGSIKGSAATIAGIAFAGDRGVRRVQVSTDGGKSWQDADLKPPLSGYSWVLWHQDWTSASPGSTLLIVRATDGNGVTQTSAHAPPIPDGSSGYHSRTIRVG
jgi:DMSO/TMAO reductase YedYZ molybdopterin-dependent catalytic subunit